MDRPDDIRGYSAELKAWPEEKLWELISDVMGTHTDMVGGVVLVTETAYEMAQEMFDLGFVKKQTVSMMEGP